MEIIKRPVEKMGESLKKIAWMAVMESLLTLVLGLFLVVWPETVISTISYVVGGFLIVRGGYQIINYLIVKGQNNFFNNDLLWGVITVLTGVGILVAGEGIANVFRIVVGIWIIYEALARMNTALKLSTAGISAWRYVLILALVMLILGVFVTFNQGAVTVLVGWLMIITGLMGVVGDVVFIQHVNAIVNKVVGKE